MAYSPPALFSASTKLVASTFTSNTDALRVYLHSGIIAGDVSATDWADTRHIAGPPEIDPVSGVQHGVTGHQGGQTSVSSLARLTFATQALNGPAAVGLAWSSIPLTSIRIEVRRRSDIIMSWWAETIAGPDDRPSGTERRTFIGYYVGNVSFTSGPRTSTHLRNTHGFDATSPYKVMPDLPWEFSGWNDSEGTVVTHKWSDNFVGVATVGLAAFGNVSRTAILNWGVTIESYT